MRFGDYEVLEQVAVGSTGTVFRARHVATGRAAAVKQLSADVRTAPGVLERLRAEAGVLRALDDPHVVALLDVGLDDEPPWIAEQWVDGPTLDRLLQVHGALTAEQAVGVLRGALQGLAHAHDRQVVHRDVAPGNVLLDSAGTSMLVDFGLAGPVGTRGVCGTPAFLCPEAAAGNPVGKAGDVYSAGAVLFLLLAGRPLFPGGDVETVLRAHREQPPPALEGHGQGFAALVARCLAKDPATRPPDAAALLAELDEQADRRFGAGWLSGASVAGVVTAVAAQSAAGAPGPGLAGGRAADTVLLTTAAVGTGTAARAAALPGPQRRRLAGRTGLLAAAAGAVGLGVVAVAAVTLIGGDAGSGATPGPPSSSPVSEARRAAATASGRYQVERTVVSTTYEGRAVGDTSSVVWTVTFDCTATTECTGRIGTDSGDQYELTLGGGGLMVTGSGRQEGPCVEVGTDIEDPDSLGASIFEVQSSFTDFGALATGAEEVVGTETQRTTYEPLRNCDLGSEPDEETATLRVVRLS